MIGNLVQIPERSRYIWDIKKASEEPSTILKRGNTKASEIFKI
jgi:hypothetical protein